jgi:hypothetical protein
LSAFTKEHIPGKYFLLLEIGSYKIRLCAGRFKNRKIQILGYHEKRQDTSFFAWNECINVLGLCENIRDMIQYLESKIEKEINDIIISYPFGELFLSSKDLSYRRNSPEEEITRAELKKIITRLESMSLNYEIQKIWKENGYQEDQLGVILSRIHALRLDGKQQDHILGKDWTLLQLKLVNALIPKNKHELVIQISQSIGKNILQILPSEYAMLGLFPEEEILIINLGANNTSLTYRSASQDYAIRKFPLGIHQLCQQIQKHSPLPYIEILDTLESEVFQEEREKFLEIWTQSYGLCLSEMLGKHMLPKKIFFTGGGSHNSFLRKAILKLSYWKYNVAAPKQLEFVHEDIAPILRLMEHIRIEDTQKIPLEIYSLLLEQHHILGREHENISLILMDVLSDLWYQLNN